MSLPRQLNSERHTFLNTMLKSGPGMQPEHLMQERYTDDYYATSKSNGDARGERGLSAST